MALLCHNLRPTDLVWWLIWYSSFTQWCTTSRSKKTSARTHINLQDGLHFLFFLWLRVRVKVTVRTSCLFLNIEMQYIFFHQQLWNLLNFYHSWGVKNKLSSNFSSYFFFSYMSSLHWTDKCNSFMLFCRLFQTVQFNKYTDKILSDTFWQRP